ncbi:MAG TPA: STAS domain-containing protein [Gemmataceae bacterium]|nr:STAS domain-containing protein [Gemmataceae bacterium]
MTAPSNSPPIVVEQVGAVTVVRFAIPEVLHADVIDSVGERLSALVEDEGRRLLLLDFSAVHKVSSSLLGQIIALHRRLLALRGRLALCGLNSEVRRVFDLCQLPRLLHLCPDEPTALLTLSRDAEAVAGERSG